MVLDFKPPLRRLPGVRFEVPPEAPDDALPRMDIAFFVGFAASGPLTAAVVVESLAEFETVFGSGLALARDAATGEPVSGLLHPAVRGFFSQGGRRCWVLRVAGAGARSSRCALPGLLAVERTAPGNPWQCAPATLIARSPGTGGDAVQVATRVIVAPLRASLLQSLDGRPCWRIANAPPGLLRPGDLLRIVNDDLHLHCRVASVTMMDEADPASTAQRVMSDVWLVLQRLQASSPAPLPFGVALPALAPLEPGGPKPTVTALTDTEWLHDGRLSVRVRVPLQRLPQRGEVLGLAFSLPLATAQLDGWMSLAEVELSRNVDLDGCIETTLIGTPWQHVDTTWNAVAAALPGGTTVYPAHLLRLDLQAHASPGDRWLLSGLSMANSGNPPDLGVSACRLSDDETVFSPQAASSDAGPALQELAQRDALGRLRQRFPLASDPLQGDRCLLPLGDLAEFDASLGALASPLTVLERDGLASFEWNLFGERTLAPHGSDQLADAAEALCTAGRVPRPLRGMHAAFGGNPPEFADEPTLLAVPDAVHAGWRPVAQPASAWTELPSLPEPPHPCAEKAFQDCASLPLPRPRFVRGADPLPDGRFTLYWTQATQDAHSELQESLDPGFTTAVTISDGPAARYDAAGRKPGAAFYRVRVRHGRRISPWSAPVRIEVGAQGHETLRWQPAQLLAIHRLMLRTAAARGDMLAVLSMPAHFDAAQAAAYSTALRSTRSDIDLQADGPSAIGDDETRALSHGALHHPWMMIRRDDERIWFPPDGSACGHFAAGALERGAWIAVANKPLRDVVALGLLGMRPTLQQRQQLLEAQVNLLRSAAIGFIVSTADTLSPDADWRPINVRRLMCLLRRLALRRGVTYVFEPHGAVLRRTVERGFQAVLDDLFRRGAFAGARAEAAYRVNVSDEINTPQPRDAAQFWIELQVAPALPMSFLTVRLSRSGERVLSKETH